MFGLSKRAITGLAFLPGFLAVGVICCIFDATWTWFYAGVSTGMTLVMLAFYFYETHAIISNMGKDYQYYEVLFPVTI